MTTTKDDGGYSELLWKMVVMKDKGQSLKDMLTRLLIKWMEMGEFDLTQTFYDSIVTSSKFLSTVFRGF